jgi:hypothetical protein
MADPYLALEAGTESSQPREFVEIVVDAVTTYRIASGTRDVGYAGNVYVASPMARTEHSVATADTDAQLTLALPLSHPLCQRYFAQGSPPRQVAMTFYRSQPGGLVERFTGGLVFSVAVERTIAKFAVQTRFRRAMARSLPVFTVTALCPHILYDANCRFPRGLGTIGDDGTALTVTGFDGRLITISDIGGEPDGWANNGELVVLATGERMPIFLQVGTVLTLQAPIPGIQVGDAITVSAGCAKDIVTCHVKFANQVNFGGFGPQLPTKNPFVPTSAGLEEQD